MTTFQQPDSLQYNTSNNELQFPTHLFVDTAAEWVDDLPHDIDGLKLYKIKCSPQEWIQKSQDYEVLQDAFLEKEGPDRNKEGWKVHQKSVLLL